ncbi:MAG: hypothetical protein KBG48_24985 [Kofleriaceae bacterium]|jgi:hypothetical protein|nr:hypothetical protein [Kofleriaceae bacterium]MBP9170683.1 hypothetical protein [Kofleriaceae bacterium]MBP9860395.1 hypothetical protein [Kofleriaceae bacterium]
MPSITYWNRLEPRARSSDLAGALAARVRDPAWFLARQWQLGELTGEDAGSPAYVRVAAAVAPMVGWQAGTGSAVPIAANTPLERAALAEPMSTDDVSRSAELGTLLDTTLLTYDVADLRSHWLDAFPIGEAPADAPDDPRAARLRRLWQGRMIDGLAVYAAAIEPTSPPAPPAGVPPTVPPTRWAQCGLALEAFRAYIDSSHPGAPIGASDAATWLPERLQQGLRTVIGEPGAAAGSVGAAVLEAFPDGRGDLPWYGFDRVTDAPPPGLPAPVRTEITRSVIPGPVKFRGQPNERFWDFEDRRVDFGALRLDRRDLTSMLLVDFMLVHGNDWYLVPFEQPVGTLCRSELTVVDVFGMPTTVPPADEADSTIPGKRFSLFRVSGMSAGHLVPNSVAGVAHDGRVLEEVRFVRDETANLAWGIERTTEGHLGRGLPGRDRVGATPPPPITTGVAPLRYQLQGHVPAHWIPFQVVALPPATSGQVALEMASLLAPDGAPGAPLVSALPAGKILRPSSLAGAPYRIREEEVPREGTHVIRLARFARSSDGGSHLWVARKRVTGSGEGHSGLRFDHTGPLETVVPGTDPEPATPLRWSGSPGWNDADWS